MIARLQANAARDKLSGIEAHVMDGQNLDLPDDSFDAAASVFGLIFFPDRVRGLSEMQRVLRPGGKAVLATWSTPPRVAVVSLFSDAVRDAMPDMPTPTDAPAIFSFADPARIEAEAREAGFSDVKTTSVTHMWRMPTPEHVWTDLAPASPVFQHILDKLDDDERERVRLAVIAHASKAMRDGVVELPGEAHIAVLTA